MNTLYFSGELHGKTLLEMNMHVRAKYGQLAKFPGLLGKRDIVFTFNPKDYATVYRTEGAMPLRRALETFEYYRKTVRPEVFGGIGGLLFDQGKTWHEMRTAVSPVLLRPTAVKSYVPIVDKVSREFVDKMREMQDDKGEMPANFNDELSLWAIEAIGEIALDKRMGILTKERNEEAEQLIHVLLKIFLYLGSI